MRQVHELSNEENERLLNALQNWDDKWEIRRVRAVRLSGKGWHVSKIAEALDVCNRSVRNWINWYEQEGLEGLRTDERPGRPPKIDQHYRDLLTAAVQKQPREMGYPFNRWTLKRLVRHMEEKTGVSVTPERISQVLHEMGFTYKRPKHDLSHKRDEELYEKKKSELDDLKKGAIREKPSYRMLFVDECEIHLNPPLTRIWARRGKPTKVRSAGIDEKAVVYGAWDFAADSLISRISEKKNSREFVAFLKQVLAEEPTGPELLLVMDNAGYHRANRVVDFVQECGDAAQIFWLPPYSPELNLIERVWKYLKQNVTNNYFFGDLETLVQATEQACEHLGVPQEKMLDLNFKTGKDLVKAA